MAIIVYFENACYPNEEKDEYGLVVEGGGNYAEIAALYETDDDYNKAFPMLAKKALANRFNMITESETDDASQIRLARLRLGLDINEYSKVEA